MNCMEFEKLLLESGLRSQLLLSESASRPAELVWAALFKSDKPTTNLFLNNLAEREGFYYGRHLQAAVNPTLRR